jgi:ABC-type nitrate/sulfonate/bicarbonate transport system substrate-binding protein
MKSLFLHLRAALLISVLMVPPLATAQVTTPWGWPQPYEQISPKSVEWLKAKDWWPLTVAWQPSFAGQNASIVAMTANSFLVKRGLENKLEPMASGGIVNKAVVEGKAQVGSGGNFPLTLLVDQQAPIRVVAITAPNLKHQVIVPIDSPIKQMSDFKGRSTPATIGMVLGSSAEFYFQASAAANGVRFGKDIVLKNVTQPEQAKMPADLAAVVPWDPTSTRIVTELKTGRAIDVSYPYNVYQAACLSAKNWWMRCPTSRAPSQRHLWRQTCGFA